MLIFSKNIGITVPIMLEVNIAIRREIPTHADTAKADARARPLIK